MNFDRSIGNGMRFGNDATATYDGAGNAGLGSINGLGGTDTLNGGRLVIDLASGLSTVDGTASGSSIGAPGAPAGQGRVTGSFTVPQKN